MNLKLGLKRVSQLPNANRQFCYQIVSGDTTGVAGVVTREDGQRLFWSFTRRGELNKLFNFTGETRTATGKGGKGEYIQLTDTVGDTIGEVGYIASIAERAGLDRTSVHNEAARKIFGNNEVTKATPVNQPSTTVQPAVIEQPATEEGVAEAGATVEENAPEVEG